MAKVILRKKHMASNTYNRKGEKFNINSQSFTLRNYTKTQIKHNIIKRKIKKKLKNKNKKQ